MNLTYLGSSGTSYSGLSSDLSCAPLSNCFEHGQPILNKSNRASSILHDAPLSPIQNDSTSSKVNPSTLTMYSPASTLPPPITNVPNPLVRSSLNSGQKTFQNLSLRMGTGRSPLILRAMPTFSHSPIGPKSSKSTSVISYNSSPLNENLSTPESSLSTELLGSGSPSVETCSYLTSISLEIGRASCRERVCAIV